VHSLNKKIIEQFFFCLLSLTCNRHKVGRELQQLMVVMLLLLLLLLLLVVLVVEGLIHGQAALVRCRLPLVRQDAAVGEGLNSQSIGQLLCLFC
jgi:hypothetical protein